LQSLVELVQDALISLEILLAFAKQATLENDAKLTSTSVKVIPVKTMAFVQIC